MPAVPTPRSPGRNRQGQMRAPTQSCLKANQNVKLYPHQERVAMHLQNARGVLCVHGTGTGKTLTAAATATCLMMGKVVSQVVVLTKKSAVEQFKAEMLRYWPQLPEQRLVCTTHVTFFKNHADAVPAEGTLLVVDEAHEFVNVASVSFQRLHAYALRCKRVLLLTATPIINSPYDLAPLTALVKGLEQVPSTAQFEATLSNASAFRKWFAGVVDVHVINKNSNPAYPRLTVKEQDIPMSQDTAREYVRRLKTPSAFHIQLRQLSLGFGSKCEKCEWLVKHVRKWIQEGEGKIVVYTAFVDRGATVLRKLLQDNGVNVLVIDGSASSNNRRQAAQLFNRKKNEEYDPSRHTDLRALVEEKNDRNGLRCGKDGVLVTRTTLDRDKAVFKYHEGMTTKVASDESRQYAESLVIPPAWSPAEVCKHNNKLLWVAQDGKGKWQYRYSKDWAVQQEFKKILRLKTLDARFWAKYSTQLGRDLRSSLPSRRATAIAAHLLNTCHFRVGGKTDDAEADNDTDEAEQHYGLTTLLKKHVQLRKGAHIQFVGKSGKRNVCNITDPLLVEQLRWLVQASTQRREDRLFAGLVDAPMLRRYISSIRAGLRPKDFRTYFANHMLLEQLRHGPAPLELTARQRQRRLNEALKLVSAGLNNTPRVAKSSYIFTGLWVLYQVDPTRFQQVLKAHAAKPTADVLDAFIHLFDTNTIDWRYMMEWQKETKAEFLGPAQVLIITDAGSESIDLAGTRHIVFMDPTWTPALEDQIIGRGQRFASHAHLPQEQRTVSVWKLYLTNKQDKAKQNNNNNNKRRAVFVEGSELQRSLAVSVEHHISGLVDAKRKEQRQLYDKLKKL